MCATILRLITILVLFSLVMGISSNQLESRREKRSGFKYCGRYLANVIQLVCDGRYNPLLVKKKSSVDMTQGELLNSIIYGEEDYREQNVPLDELALPFRPRPISTALVPRSFRRLPRGAHDECCVKSCTIQEIRTYCAPSK